MKICFLGNSHLGPFMAVGPQHVQNTGHQARFVAQRSFGTVPLRFSSMASGKTAEFPDIKIVDESQSPDPIDVNDWDALVLVGFGFGLMGIQTVLGTCRPDSDPRESDLPLLSEGAFQETLDNYFDDQPSCQILRSLQELEAERLVLIPQAHPLSWIATRDDRRLRWWQSTLNADLSGWLRAQFDHQVERVEARGITVIRQPEETVTESALTLSEFGMAQDVPNNSFWENVDYYHTNKSLADLTLHALLDRLQP